MSRTIIEVTYIDPNVCFECGAPATERHHVIPHSLGGTKTVPLCGRCHAKVHGVDGERRAKIAELTKRALQAKKERGETWNRGTAGVEVARKVSAKRRMEKRLKWLQEAPVCKYVAEKYDQGITFAEMLKNLEIMYEIDPNRYCTRNGAKFTSGTLWRIWDYVIKQRNGCDEKEVSGDNYNEETKVELTASSTAIADTRLTKKIKRKRELSEAALFAIEEYTKRKRDKKQEWLENSEACNFIREIHESYKTRYLLADEKIKLFNEKHTLSNGKKITSNGQWSILKNSLGYTSIVTATSEKIAFLSEWAKQSLCSNIECRFIAIDIHDRSKGYIITPLNTLIETHRYYTWIYFLEGLSNDNVINIKEDCDTLICNFSSKEVIEKIVYDFEN